MTQSSAVNTTDQFEGLKMNERNFKSQENCWSGHKNKEMRILHRNARVHMIYNNQIILYLWKMLLLLGLKLHREKLLHLLFLINLLVWWLSLWIDLQEESVPLSLAWLQPWQAHLYIYIVYFYWLSVGIIRICIDSKREMSQTSIYYLVFISDVVMMV